ncbi:MAG: NAD(+) synthase [Oscillospiraceae bacterium]|nr:NAD(+) synthase [Oscillospiraceae bacterium]
MRDYAFETKRRIAFIRETVQSAGVSGIVFGNSGGKDSALVGILCKLACDDTVGIILPCGTRQNYESDTWDAQALADQFGIARRIIDMSHVQSAMMQAVETGAELSDTARSNIAPRLRMTALYAIAASEGRLVAGTSNRSEIYVGYSTKWGDAACDFNPIADLTVTEIYEFLRYLNAPAGIIEKAPSGGLFEGQTDEAELGVTYCSIDEYLFTGAADEADRAIIERHHRTSEHKRQMPTVFEG